MPHYFRGRMWAGLQRGVPLYLRGLLDHHNHNGDNFCAANREEDLEQEYTAVQQVALCGVVHGASC